MIQPVFDIGINFVFRSVYQIDRLADPVFLTDVFDQPERIRRLVKDIRSHVTFVPTGRIADQKIPLAGFGQKTGSSTCSALTPKTSRQISTPSSSRTEMPSNRDI